MLAGLLYKNQSEEIMFLQRQFISPRDFLLIFLSVTFSFRIESGIGGSVGGILLTRIQFSTNLITGGLEYIDIGNMRVVKGNQQKDR